jgi:hypothetical protein
MADNADKNIASSTNRLAKTTNKISLCILAAAMAGQLVYWVSIVNSKIELLVRRLPDDSFYYLKLAMSFAETGRWSFDGHTVTSGFHLIYAYVLAGLYAIAAPSPEGFVRLALALSIALAVAFDVYLFVRLRRFKSLHLNLGVLSLLSSPLFFINAFTIVEWSMMFFISILFLDTAYQVLVRSESNRSRILTLFLLGVAGSLTRSDFGLVPVSLVAATVLIYRGQRSRFAPPFAGLAGAIFGLIIVFGHNYFFSGEVLQSSAKLKAHWATVEGFSGQLFRSLMLDSFGVVFFSIMFLSILLGAVLVVMKRIKLSALVEKKKDLIAFFLFSVFAVIGYTAFYSFSSTAGQPWYNVHVLIPLIVIGAASLGVVERTSTKLLLALAILISAAAAHKEATFLTRMPSMWTHQSCMYRAQAELKDFGAHRYGAWNTGIVGYFSKAEVVNIDGLVNNEIYPYVIEDRLFTYLAKRNIDYLIDFENMFTEPIKRRRGGYDNFDLENFLRPTSLDFGGCGKLWSRLMLLEIRYPTISLGAVMRFDSKDLMFSGWEKTGPNGKTSLRRRSDIIFRLPADADVQGSLLVKLEAPKERRIEIAMNEHVLGTPLVSAGNQPFKTDFNPAIANRHRPNVVQLGAIESDNPVFEGEGEAPLVFISLQVK